jgi:hypothetical protein
MHFTRKPPTLLASTKTLYRRLSDIEFSAISPQKKKAKMDQAYILYEKLVDKVQKGQSGRYMGAQRKSDNENRVLQQELLLRKKILRVSSLGDQM